MLDKNAAVPKLIFYDGFRIAYISFVIGIIFILLFDGHKIVVTQYKDGFIIVLLSCIIVPLFVGCLKAITNVPCPHNIERYGGDYPYVTVLTQYPATFQQTRRIQCFSAAHASSGFALMSLYYLFSAQRRKKAALLTAIGIGWMTGSYKMLIGDHFVSHIVITMIISWLIIILIVWAVNHCRSTEANDLV